jgi:hypothetical protein
MSLDLYVGVLVDRVVALQDDPTSANFYKHYTELFDQIEQALPLHGAVPHHEPRDRKGMPTGGWRIKRELVPFRNAADEVAERLNLDFRHISECSNYSTVFVPVSLPTPFTIGDTAVCSSIDLARNCCVIATALGVLDAFNPWPDDRFWATDAELSAEMDRAEQIQATMNTLFRPEPASVTHTAANGCGKMLLAAHLSLETGSSVVISG